MMNHLAFVGAFAAILAAPVIATAAPVELTLTPAPAAYQTADGPNGYVCPYKARIKEYDAAIADLSARGVFGQDVAILRWHQDAIRRTARHIAQDGRLSDLERDFMLSRLDDQAERIDDARNRVSRLNGAYGGATQPAAASFAQTIYVGR